MKKHTRLRHTTAADYARPPDASAQSSPGAAKRLSTGPVFSRLQHRHKRLLAAAGLGLATVMAVWFAIPGQQATQPVVVASTSIDAGSELKSAQLKIAHYPPQLVPDSAFADIDALIGATASTWIAPGMPVTGALTLGSADSIAPGFVQVAVTFADQASAGILKPGHRIRVYSTVDESNTQALTEATVAGTAETPDSLTGKSSVITLTVPEDDAAKVAQAAPGGLTFALVSGRK